MNRTSTRTQMLWIRPRQQGSTPKLTLHTDHMSNCPKDVAFIDRRHAEQTAADLLRFDTGFQDAPIAQLRASSVEDVMQVRILPKSASTCHAVPSIPLGSSTRPCIPRKTDATTAATVENDAVRAREEGQQSPTSAKYVLNYKCEPNSLGHAAVRRTYGSLQIRRDTSPKSSNAPNAHLKC